MLCMDEIGRSPAAGHIQHALQHLLLIKQAPQRILFSGMGMGMGMGMSPAGAQALST